MELSVLVLGAPAGTADDDRNGNCRGRNLDEIGRRRLGRARPATNQKHRAKRTTRPAAQAPTRPGPSARSRGRTPAVNTTSATDPAGVTRPPLSQVHVGVSPWTPG